MIAKYIVAYIATGIAFAAIDSIWLRNMYTRLYQPEIGELMMKGGFRMGPAVMFYLLYILGMMIFAVGPALQSREVANGAHLGRVARLLSAI